MRLLLDSHVLLWLATDDPKLGAAVRTVIADGSNTVLASVASLWELTIKAGIGKLILPTGFHRLLVENGVTILPIDVHHIDRLDRLPRHHGAPFDRMLIAQAQADGLTLVSADRTIRLYDVPVLWS
ncbi:type II toxin-antitoxin system VapC family toxin [Azospirillum sp. Sh1]|uniref:type II toxin-antitoxin system VapC family toxin n=1 Tax=Azospirillum sp. Sh1 TaxID=2607285 RepID=UPI0011F051A1|nr:type II toxin-antitoxin system VapC family toxin [Azospirillum sp. Sh1]KAA0575629.1 type II toxin-antitoxin system VapC family toxin [Azospirillum sp. Sh1]